eukprot:19424-Heterococcus_DN1.PRE.1
MSSARAKVSVNARHMRGALDAVLAHNKREEMEECWRERRLEVEPPQPRQLAAAGAAGAASTPSLSPQQPQRAHELQSRASWAEAKQAAMQQQQQQQHSNLTSVAERNTADDTAQSLDGSSS